MSQVDQTFKENCRSILLDGTWQEGRVRAKWEDGTPALAKKSFALINRYDLSAEFPLLTLRPLNYKAAFDEILWIWQLKSNRLSDLHSGIWDQWGQADGTIGKAYGYQLGKISHYPEGDFDQVDKLLYDLRQTPESRRLIAHMYNVEELSEMALYPCAYSLTLHVDAGRLSALLNQRSQDMLVANGWNVCQYALLVHMFAQVSNLQVGELVHVIADAHIYDRHIPLVEELLQRPEFPAAHFVIDRSIANFYDFKVSSFAFTDYLHGQPMRSIPVAV